MRPLLLILLIRITVLSPTIRTEVGTGKAGKMPAYFNQGQSALFDILDGEAGQQIEALHHYIRLGDEMGCRQRRRGSDFFAKESLRLFKATGQERTNNDEKYVHPIHQPTCGIPDKIHEIQDIIRLSYYSLHSQTPPQTWG